ncbi:MAG: hypothetical protein ABMA64_17600 [Myxococcota bacterium]
MSRVEQLLAEYPETAVTSRLLKALYGAIPGAPAFEPMTTFEQVAASVAPGADPTAVVRARDIADRTPEIADVLWMGKLMDAGDKGFAVVGGLMAAFRLFQGKGAEALENDTAQRNDAVLKALGLAYMVYRAYPGSVADKVRAFSASPAGKSLAVYYGAVEVALPFADNAAMAGAGGLSNLLQSQSAAQAARLGQMAEGHDVGQAREMLTHLVGSLQGAASSAAGYVKPVTQAVGPYLPTAAFGATAVDKAAGAIATAADVLPVYTLLSARLAAESAMLRAAPRG